jgi:hypothetical protein
MTSLLDGRPGLLGAQRPRILSTPPAVSSTGAEAVELAAIAGLDLDPWQQFALECSLSERADGKWAAFGVGIVVPRQNGKGGILEARELAGLFLLEERLIIHSAHQFDTSQEAFERLVALIESTPSLSKRLARNGISRSHGSEGVKLKNGHRIRFRTRTKGGGRGFTCDCLILDEAMIVPDSFMGAVLPTLSARPNPQIWYTGSAVDQEIHEHGLVLARVRERGLKGDDPSLFYAEWSAFDNLGEVTIASAEDPEAWARANPAMGIRISEEYIANERREFASNLRGYAVERLGVGDWPRTDHSTGRVIDPDDWSDGIDEESKPKDPLCFAFDITPDRSRTTISVCGDRSDGLPHIETIENRRGTGWVASRLGELVKAHKTWEVLCDAAGPASSLVTEVEEAVGKKPNGDSRLLVVSSKEYAQACGIFFDAVADGRLRHLGTSDLTEAVDGARSRPLGEAWAWHRKTSDVDISPLVAATLALFGNTRRPKNRSRVINLNAID